MEREQERLRKKDKEQIERVIDNSFSAPNTTKNKNPQGRRDEPDWNHMDPMLGWRGGLRPPSAEGLHTEPPRLRHNTEDHLPPQHTGAWPDLSSTARRTGQYRGGAVGLVVLPSESEGWGGMT